MLNRGFFSLLLLSPSLVLAMPAKQNYKIHMLAEGETLSELLYKENYKPLYGKDNWVQRIMEINHLTPETAAQIKKGYPLILPGQETKITVANIDTITTTQASQIYYGLVGNKISNHQDIYLDFAFYQTDLKLQNTTAEQNSNFKIGFTYQDKNTRTFQKFSYNPEVSFYTIGHGAAEFSDKNLSATFEPTLQAQTAIMMNHPNIDYRFGPYIELLEKSNLENQDQYVNVRRDRFANIGAKANQTFEKNNMIYLFSASMGATLASQSLNNNKAMQMVTTAFNADVNLTRDYFVGAFWRRDNYSNTTLQNDTAIGINLKYFVK